MPGVPVSLGKNSFAGGEFSPEQQVRVDLTKYASGLKTARNFYVQKVGGAVNRPGTHYRAKAKNNGKKIRMVPFQFSSSQRYALEFGDQYARLFTNGGQVQVTSGDTPQTIPSYSAVLDPAYKLIAETNGTGASFVDSSATPKIITANGNATQVQTKLTNTAMFLNGSSDYLIVPTSTDFDLGTGDLTIEFYFMRPGAAGGAGHMFYDRSNAAATGLIFYYDGTSFYIGGGPSKSWAVTINTFTWYHVALVRSSGTWQLYINGVGQGTYSSSVNLNYTTDLWIGHNHSGVSYLNGWLKEFRIRKDAFYTGNFTPPTSEFAPDANTVLLLHGDTTAKQPLCPAIWCDSGTASYVTTPNVSSLSGDFTIEGWFMQTTTGDFFLVDGGYASNFGLLYTGATFRIYVNNSYYQQATSFTTLANVWYHVACVRISNTVTIYINGQSYGSSTLSGTGSASGTMGIGAQANGSNKLSGYLKGIRVVIGTGVYTTNFTPPQAPLTAITNTKLLILANDNNGTTGTSIVESSTGKVLTCTGSAQIKYVEDYRNTIFVDSETTPKYPYPVGTAKIDWITPFGNGIGYLPVSASVSLANSPDWDLGTTDLTINTWVKWATVGTSYLLSRNGDTDYSLQYYSGNLIWKTAGSAVLTVAFTPVANVLYFIEFIRVSGVDKLFINGTLQATTASDTTNYASSNGITVGNKSDNSQALLGFLKNFTVTKGAARHTTTFNPPDTVDWTGGSAPAWVTGTQYYIGNFVTQSAVVYYCLVNHKAGAFATDLSSGYWAIAGSTYAGVPAWSTPTAYIVGNFVIQSSVIYYCIVSHTSGTFATDLAAGKWVAQTTYEIVTPYLETELPSLRWAQSADTMFVSHPVHPPYMLQRIGNTNWQLNAYPYINGPFMIANTDTTKTITPSAATGSVTLTAAGHAPFNVLHVGSLWQFNQPIAGSTSSLSLTSAAAQSSIACGGTWRLITHGTWTGKFNVEKSTDGGTTWAVVRTFASTNDNNVNTYGTETNPSGNKFLVRINYTSYTSGTLNVDLTTDAFTQVGIAKVTAYTSSTVVTATVLTDLGLSTACVDWAEGSWSNYRGFPSTVTFDQNRLCFASTTSEPNTVWMSETGNYYNYAISQPLVDTDAIDALLPARELNAISALVPLLGLVAFTTSGEWAVGDPGVILSPSTIAVRPNSYYGSNGVQPVVVGNRIIFVQSSGTVIRDLAYQYFYNYFDGADISVFSSHLLKGHNIVDMAYQQDPDCVIWIVRDDGQLIALTYLREQDVIAMTHCDTNNGTDAFETICTIQGTGYKEVWVSVNRGGQRYIEQFDQRMNSTAIADQFFVDCGVTYSGSPATVIGGLGHLLGKSVAVLADGVVVANALTPMTVVTDGAGGGQITLSTAASKVQIGIPIISDLETLNVEIPTPAGSAQGKKVLVTKVLVEFMQSAGGYAGREFSNLFALSTMATGALYTGPCREQLAGGYQDGGRICLRQYDPLPMTVLSIVPVYTLGGMSTEVGTYT